MSPILGNIIAIALVVALVALCIHTLMTTKTCAGCGGSCAHGGACESHAPKWVVKRRMKKVIERKRKEAERL